MNTASNHAHLDPATATHDEIVPAGAAWTWRLTKGQTLRIFDLEGNQAVDTLFFSANDTSEHYSVSETIVTQRCLYLTVGTVLISSEGNPMLTITADNCGRHDTLGGACAGESNQVRYALSTLPMHSCRDSFLLACAESPWGLTKRDLVSNINFFMNVPVTPEGRLSFEDGISGPGKFVDLRAEMDVIVLVSNCPQLNNPCNAYNPTPVRMLVWD